MLCFFFYAALGRWTWSPLRGPLFPVSFVVPYLALPPRFTIFPKIFFLSVRGVCFPAAFLINYKFSPAPKNLVFPSPQSCIFLLFFLVFTSHRRTYCNGFLDPPIRPVRFDLSQEFLSFFASPPH